MPNWCHNTLIVNAAGESKIEDLKEFCGDGENELSFEKIIPTPPEVTDGKEGTGMTLDEYEWRCNNWGTKWEPDEIQVVRDDEYEWELRFMTAWSPPVEIVQELSSRFPDMIFRLIYDEPGMAIHGAIAFHGGAIVV